MDVIQEKDIIQEIEVIEKDLEQVNEKCRKINCSAVYDSIIAMFKLLYDLIYICCKKKD